MNKTFEDLECWKKSRVLVKRIYEVSQNTSLRKDYGLKNQVCRSCVSVMSNIAEGFDRSSNKEFVYFLNVSKGSCAEFRSQLYVLRDLEYINENEFRELYKLAKDISKMIQGLISYLKKHL